MDESMLEPDILYSEVKEVMRTGKAPVMGNIPAELFKESGEEGLQVMHMTAKTKQ